MAMNINAEKMSKTGKKYFPQCAELNLYVLPNIMNSLKSDSVYEKKNVWSIDVCTPVFSQPNSSVTPLLTGKSGRK